MAKQPKHIETEQTEPEPIEQLLPDNVINRTRDEPAEVVEGDLVQAPMSATAVVPTYDPEYLDSCQNLSQKIRYLSSRGLTTSQIVKVIKYNAHGGPLIYQHVRNILLQKVKKSA